MYWYRTAWRRFADFEGRSRRTEYWAFILTNCLITWILGAVEVWIGTWPSISVLFAIGVIMPTLGVSIRRLHDIGHGGAWLLIGLIPGGALVLLVFFLLDGERGENRFGRDPKERADRPRDRGTRAPDPT